MVENKVFDKSSFIKIAVGSVLGAFAVWLAVRGVSLDRLGEVLSQADPWLTAAGVGIVLLNVTVLGLRWWVMLNDRWDASLFLALLGGVYLGQMFNILLPARLGELARFYFVSERAEYTKSRLMGSLVLEKVIDIITFGLALFLLISLVTLPAWVLKPGRTFLYLAGVSLAVVVILVVWGRTVLRQITPLLYKLPDDWGDRLAGILERTLSGLDSMKEGKLQLVIWTLAVFSLILSTATNQVVLRALSIPVPVTAALFVLIVIQIGSAPPSSPGKLGVFHYLVVLALSAYGIDKETALAYSVLLYLVALLPKVIIGVGVVVFSRWRIPDLNLKLKIEN